MKSNFPPFLSLSVCLSVLLSLFFSVCPCLTIFLQGLGVAFVLVSGGPRLNSDVFLTFSPYDWKPFIWDKVSLNLELTRSCSLAGQGAPGIPLSVCKHQDCRHMPPHSVCAWELGIEPRSCVSQQALSCQNVSQTPVYRIFCLGYCTFAVNVNIKRRNHCCIKLLVDLQVFSFKSVCGFRFVTCFEGAV